MKLTIDGECVHGQNHMELWSDGRTGGKSYGQFQWTSFIEIPHIEYLFPVGVYLCGDDDYTLLTNEWADPYVIAPNGERIHVWCQPHFGYPVSYRPDDPEWVELKDRLTKGLIEIFLHE